MTDICLQCKASLACVAGVAHKRNFVIHNQYALLSIGGPFDWYVSWYISMECPEVVARRDRLEHAQLTRQKLGGW